MRHELQPFDWAIIALYGVFALVLGILFTRRASTGIESFFVGDRKLPWWLAGTSIVATTFAADTPLAVAGLVASGGIAGNWIWWSWGIAHVCSTFFFARLWRRANVITDAELTELRYHGKPAAALRAFKAVYFGVFINGLTMAWVIAAMVKISKAFFTVDPVLVVVMCTAFSVVYTTLGGFRSVVFTDLFQFALGIIGSIVLAVYAVSEFGGMGSPEGGGLLGKLSEVTEQAGRDVRDVLAFVPDAAHPTTPLIYFVVLLIAGWWRYAEGNGYIVQRLAACKDEGHAQGASLWFSLAHNALRPWPWILVGLSALVFYPMLPVDFDAASAKSADGEVVLAPAQLDPLGTTITVRAPRSFTTMQLLGHTLPVTGEAGAQTVQVPGLEYTGVTEAVLSGPDGSVKVAGLGVALGDRELAYPLLMGRLLPAGLLGLVIASLIAAFMSTIDTHTNWGASYLVRDIYQRFLRPNAPPRHYVTVSRLCIVLIAALAGVVALYIQNIAQVWRFLVYLGAGLGSVTAARWYWHRVTPHAEFAALGVTTLVAIGLQVFASPELFGAHNPWFLIHVPNWAQILIIAGASLCAWVPTALFGPQNPKQTIERFAAQVRPSGPGWPSAPGQEPPEPLTPALVRFGAGLVVVYGTLFSIGELLLGSVPLGAAGVALSCACLVWIVRSGRAGAPEALRHNPRDTSPPLGYEGSGKDAP